jgi:hypothetical protein
MNGIVNGGWNYVVSAYAVSFAVLGGYVLRTILLHFKTSAQSQVRVVTRAE